jgi:hypothetical protein
LTGVKNNEPFQRTIGQIAKTTHSPARDIRMNGANAPGSPTSPGEMDGGPRYEEISIYAIK